MSSEEDIAVKKSRKKEKKRKRESKEKLSKEERKKLKVEKKAEKVELLAKVPKVDEHGIAYTKLQIKRMIKRVKKGLNAVPTEEEERDRVRRLKQEEKETKDELAGMIFTREDDSGDDDSKDDDIEAVEEESDGEGKTSDDEEADEDGENEEEHETKQVQKKKPRSKPVPEDYVCFACKNSHKPLHWIYDCPDKVHKPGTNKVKKKLRGLHDPSSRKVFVSGLPFDVKSKDVEAYFEKEMKCGKVVHCKLLMFEDTKRCKGTGFLTFDTDEGAKKALKLNGTSFNIETDKKESKKKELTLGVKKVLNRTQTKKK